MNKSELYEKPVSKQFYEELYKTDYMETWPEEKRQRVYELIVSLPLPKTGKALDFGCGTGVFTRVLQRALPGWEIYGSDLSENAIDLAKKKSTGIAFFASDPEKPIQTKFDLVFSHHVLEHVFDIKKTAEELNAYLNKEGYMLHIFPCGNPGSYEHRISLLTKNGIDPAMENRFFYEYEGHVRRFTTEDANKLFAPYGFTLARDFYSDQYYGALKWILSDSSGREDVILKFADPTKGIDAKSAGILENERKKLLRLLHAKNISGKFLFLSKMKNKKLKHILAMAVYFPSFLLNYRPIAQIEAKARREWDTEKGQKNGSEMYLFYQRK